MDLQDATAEKPVPTKVQHKARVRALVKTKKAQKAAANIAKSLRKTCRIVIKKKGAASGR